jgi:hypothetical protein
VAHRVICCGCTKAVGIGAKRTSPAVYEYAPNNPAVRFYSRICMWDEIQTVRRARRTVRWVVGEARPHPSTPPLCRGGVSYPLSRTRCAGNAMRDIGIRIHRSRLRS